MNLSLAERVKPEFKHMVGSSGDLRVKESAQFGTGVPAFWFARAIEIGGSAMNLYQPYADSVWVQAAIKQVTGPISSIAVEVTMPSNSAKRTRKKAAHWKEGDAIPVDSAAIAEWLKEPSPGMTWEDFTQASIGFLKMSECFWVLEGEVPFPETDAVLPKIRFARPDRMKPVIEDGTILSWQYTPINGMPQFLPTDQVIRLFNWNPYDDYRGLGEYQSGSIAAESDWFAGKFGRNLMVNNGDLGGIIIAKDGVPTDAQREQIIAQLREKRQAQQRGELRYTFMTGDVDVKDPKIVSVDAPYISQRIENRHEIAVAFGVPMSRFDVKAAYSIGSASDYYQLIMDTCVPAGAKFCGAVEQFLYRMTKRRLEVSLDWDEHPVLQEVRRERIDTAGKLFSTGMPMKQVSEYLRLELPEYEGWEIGYLPINLSPVLSDEMQEPPQPEDYSEPVDDEDDTTPEPTKSLLAYLRRQFGPRSKAPNARNKKLWQDHMRKRQGPVKMYQSRASKIINDYRVKALKHLSSMNAKGIGAKSLIDVIFDPKQFGIDLSKGLDPITQTVLQTAGMDVFEEIGRPDDPWKMPPHAVKDFIARRENKIKNVGDTVHGQLKTQLAEAADKGDTMDQIADRVRSVFTNLGNFEAKRIAMTETCAAYGFARHQAMTDAGVEYKSWLSSHGPNVRPAHYEAEVEYSGNPIPVDEPFEVGGEQLMYPGDESGSPENVINCQCIQLAEANPSEEGEEE